ncbi:hypothetical protein BT96DRAFT_945323 [Gymnopus androsaceus JB14]|uniref:Uncharacterized protein n=1 Tax=Gymnopus androsaceus JB14 TaxID=1447944 RepID=A0A6A4H176_9AGAR|nr:hypothetical protein BT96DRAFT_945323 [Gymnopus androsaceus JB14]
MQLLKRSQNTAPIARGRSLTGGHHLMPHYQEIPDSDWAENSRNGFIQCRIHRLLEFLVQIRDEYYSSYSRDLGSRLTTHTHQFECDPSLHSHQFRPHFPGPPPRIPHGGMKCRLNFGEDCNIKVAREFNFTDLVLTVDTVELEACRTRAQRSSRILKTTQDKALPPPMRGMIMEIIESMDGVEWLRKEIQASHSPFLRILEDSGAKGIF